MKYEDNITASTITKEDKTNLKEIYNNIMKSECTKEFKNSIYCTLKDYYEEIIERGFKLVDKVCLPNNTRIDFKATNYYIIVSVYYYDDNDYCSINYDESIMEKFNDEQNTIGMTCLKCYNIIIDNDKYDDIVDSDIGVREGVDTEEMDNIIRRIKWNFNIK